LHAVAIALRRCVCRRAPIFSTPVFLPFFCEPAPPLLSCQFHRKISKLFFHVEEARLVSNGP
jgi:hypothetical protein